MFNFFKRKPKEERTAPVEKPAQTPAQKSPQKPNDPMATVAPAVESSATATPKKSPGKSGPAVSGEEGLKPGQTLSAPGLGDFLIHDIKGGVGKSGMGVVYIVLDESSMTPFAVKTFQQWCIGTPALVQRFLREVETWIKLEQHQNIVRAFYVSTINNQPHLFLEYVAGSDLRKKMAAGPLPVRDALRYSIQFCRGMDYAQKKVPGLVHRDVKPENCMFTPDDVLKVTDFGLVKVLSGSDKLPQQQQAPGKRLSENHTRVFKTQVGEMGVGTLPYMAPEQFTDFTHVTACADIYSFGIMLFEMLAGERPFSAKGPEQWFYKHLKIAPPEIANLNPEVSPLLAKLVSRCLAKKPEDRWHSAADLASELRWIAEGESGARISTAPATASSSGTHAVPAHRSGLGRERWAWMAAVVVLLSLVL
ncbi:MAG: protein kinase, partial [Acidobacteria bacterium]|nr:protein kinase [Acidobacteriota bacterium]